MDQDEAARINRTARILRLLTLFMAAAMVIVMVFGSWVLIAGAPESDFFSVAISNGGLPGWAAAAALALVEMLLIIALLKLAGMLRLIEQGIVAGRSSGLRGFAFFLFLSVLSAMLLPPMLRLFVGSESERQFSLDLTGSDFLILLITGLLFLVARLLDESERLSEEMRQIV